MLHSSFVLVSAVFMCWWGVDASSISFNSSNLPNIESLVFWVSNGLETFGKKCRQHSKYYCLEAYRTPSTEYESLDSSTPGGLNPRATWAWFTVLIKERWQIINMIDPESPQLCCEDQTMKYLFYGQLRKKWSPEQYLEKLTEYWDEDNKPLNLITAVYLPIVCRNLIIEIGFGPGNLTRNYNSVRPGLPYLILGGEEYGDFGIPGLRTITFDFENPGQHLTFHWFKHNIMCKDHPWICGHIAESSSNKKDNKKEDSEKKGGNKKNKRKKNSSSGKKHKLG
ncbi:uncharacterized protein LOC142350754 [Convolutriloba macropyga]|uniref:uncharacterized protein LOC142350754 n=1 Tax=Convolutriloba macropyga TaxID=536237 RepID=UPI003F521B8E